MASILPKPKPGKPLQIQFKEPNQRCTINSLTNTLKKLIPNIKEIKITSKKVPRKIINKKIYLTQVKKPTTKGKPDKEDVEYYPDKLKRNVDLKKIVLEPRHEYKVVAATNKRKRSTPVKDAGSLKKQKTDKTSPEISLNEVSFEDMIPSSIIHKIKDSKNLKNKLITDSELKNGPITISNLKNTPSKGNQRLTDLKSDSTPDKDLKSNSGPQMEGLEDFMNEESLTDEDFMEILTCPSPVWWEDPPDENYFEEPIGRFLSQENLPQNEDCTKVPSKTAQPGRNAQNSLEKRVKPITVTKNSFGNKELIEKRLKLENLLSSLKNNSVKTDKTKKLNDKVRKISSDGSELSVDDDDLVKSLQSIEIPIKDQNINNKNKENEVFCEKIEVKTKIDDVKAVNNISIAKTEEKASAKTNLDNVKHRNEKAKAEIEVIESNNHEISNGNEIKVNELVNKIINDEIGIKKTAKTNDNTKIDTKNSTENATAINSPIAEKKASSPRKSNRNSPKKHQLTKYYNLKSKRPRIIKQNPRHKIIIDHHVKTNVNFQKSPEKKPNKRQGNVSKIKKAYLDLLQQSKIENNLVADPKTSKISNNEESTKTIDKNTKQNINITETNKTENHRTESAENIKSETFSNHNEHENNTNKKKSKQINDIPLILPKLTKIPQNLAVQSPKSIKSGTSDSTDVNSEIDTISDTNIQFIDEYEEKKDEFVTVYQIISKNGHTQNEITD